MKPVVRVLVSPTSSPEAYALLPLIGRGDLTGNCQIELVLHDKEECRDQTHGVVMELMDCGFPLIQDISCTSSWHHAVVDVDLIVCLPNNSNSMSINSHVHPLLNNGAKVVLVGNPDDFGEFVFCNPDWTEENVKFINSHRFRGRPMQLSAVICNEVIPWWNFHQQNEVGLALITVFESNRVKLDRTSFEVRSTSGRLEPRLTTSKTESHMCHRCARL